MSFHDKLELALEGMVTPETLDSEKFVVVDTTRPKYVTMTIYKRKNLRKWVSECHMVDVGHGYYTVHQSASQHYLGQGYGPLLYDLAIEYATMNGKGLIPATGCRGGCNTDFSRKVWQKYYEARPDIEKLGLPEEFQQRLHYVEESQPGLYAVYRKPPVFWQDLRKLGKLFMINGQEGADLLQKKQAVLDLAQRKYEERAKSLAGR